MFGIAAAFFAASMVAFAQEQEHDALTPRRLLGLSETQVDELIQRAVNERVSPRFVDALTILLLNREELVLPKIVSRLRSALTDNTKPGDLVMRLEELLAYIGSPASLDALLSLETGYAARVERLLPIMLSQAVGRRNPFDLAYRVMDRGSKEAKQNVAQWVYENASRGHNYRDWAETLFLRSEGHVTASALAVDPILHLLPGEARWRVEFELATQVKLQSEDKTIEGKKRLR
jgi:hypothetical protein